MLQDSFFSFKNLQELCSSNKSIVSIAAFCFCSVFYVMACGMAEETIPQELVASTSNNLIEDHAAVIAVTCTGGANNYTLSVTIKSPDTGCDQYADWWEVFTAQGELIYRRILGHSHVDEQPFTRSGGPVDVGPDEFIYVRAHMNNFGYGSIVYSGTLRNDLQTDTLDTNFLIELETIEPLPTNCAF